MKQKSISRILACTSLFIAMQAAMGGEVSDSRARFEGVIAPFLKVHCVKCHGPRKSEADVTLHDIGSDFDSTDNVDLWQRVLEKIALGEMPPEREPRPDAGAVKQLDDWITTELRKSGNAVGQHRFDPVFGNYVDHDALFSGKHIGPAWSPARLWRISPYISSAKYRNRQQLGRHLNGASQPYSVSDEPNIKGLCHHVAH